MKFYSRSDYQFYKHSDLPPEFLKDNELYDKSITQFVVEWIQDQYISVRRMLDTVLKVNDSYKTWMKKKNTLRNVVTIDECIRLKFNDKHCVQHDIEHKMEHKSRESESVSEGLNENAFCNEGIEKLSILKLPPILVISLPSVHDQAMYDLLFSSSIFIVCVFLCF